MKESLKTDKIANYGAESEHKLSAINSAQVRTR
jgi:hypothetical protein